MRMVSERVLLPDYTLTDSKDTHLDAKLKPTSHEKQKRVGSVKRRLRMPSIKTCYRLVCLLMVRKSTLRRSTGDGLLQPIQRETWFFIPHTLSVAHIMTFNLPLTNLDSRIYDQL